MKFEVVLLIFSTLGIFAKDVTKIHDWVEKNIQSLEKYIQETDITSDILLGLQENDKSKNLQNWILSTNHKQHIELTDGQIKQTTAFGPESEYFTETTQNVVFLGTQIKDKEWVKFQMKKGNEDIQRMDMFTQDNYQGVSLINSNNEGAINRLLIVEKKNEIISSYEEQGKSIIQISNLSEGQSLFYILYSQNSEVGDIEKLFNYIVKNVIDLEKEPDINADEQPVTQDDGEEESDPNDVEKLGKSKQKGDGEENDGEGEEQEKQEQQEEEDHQEVSEEDCPGGEENDTIKNKVDIDSNSQLPSQEDPKNLKIQTTDVKPEESVEIVEESEEEEEITVPVEGESSQPPKKNQEEDEKSEPEPPSEEYQNCAGEELDTVKSKRDLNENLESRQERVFQAKELSINETIHEEEGEGDGHTDGQEKTQGQGKVDGDEEKTDDTDGKKDGNEGKTKDTDGKKDGTDGNEEKTHGKKDDTDGNEEKTEATDGKTDQNGHKNQDEHAHGNDHTDDQTKTKSEKENTKQELEEPCIILYSECNFSGDELKLCGANPVIPKDMKNFKVKSIKVPEGVQVTFFNKPNFDDERLHAKNEMECLETPLRLNLLELMNNLRMAKHVNISSISVTN